MSRRAFIAGVGLSALAGVGVAALRGFPTFAEAGHEFTSALHIRAATVWGDAYAALVGAADDHVTITRLHVGADRSVTVGEDLGVAWPHGFQPWGIAAIGERLLVTGSLASLFEVVTVDNRSDALPPGLRELAGDGDPGLPDAIIDYEVWHYRPALVAVEGGRVERVALPVPNGIGWGAATGIATDRVTKIAVAMDGCPDPDAHVITRCHLAVSADGGVTWQEQLVDRGLREGYATTLAGDGSSFFAVTVTGEGHRTVRRGVLGTDPSLTVVDSTDGAGPVRAVVANADGGVRLFERASNSDHIIAVNGVPGTWIAATQHGARLVSNRGE